jgi:hypothetical protein
MAEWAYLWLQKQHLYGIERNEAIQYMIEGAAARTDNTTKYNFIDVALKKCHVEAGILGVSVTPTVAYQRQMTLNAETPLTTPMHGNNSNSPSILTSALPDSVGPRRMSFGSQSASVGRPLVTDLSAVQTAEIRHLELAKISSDTHKKLVRTAINIIRDFPQLRFR